MSHECVQKTTIALLKKDNENMADNIKEIKTDVSELKKDFRVVKDFILTSPQKFASKDEFDSFKNGINIKIAYVSGGFAIFVSILSFFLNKYL